MSGPMELTEDELYDLAESRGQILDNVIHTQWFFDLCVAYQDGDIEL